MFVCKYVCKHACRPAMVLGLSWRGLVCRGVAWRGLVCCVASNGMRESSSLDKVWWSVSVTVAFHSTRLDFDSIFDSDWTQSSFLLLSDDKRFLINSLGMNFPVTCF